MARKADGHEPSSDYKAGEGVTSHFIMETNCNFSSLSRKENRQLLETETEWFSGGLSPLQACCSMCVSAIRRLCVKMAAVKEGMLAPVFASKSLKCD